MTVRENSRLEVIMNGIEKVSIWAHYATASVNMSIVKQLR